MATFRRSYASKGEEILDIPNGMGPYIIGTEGHNTKRMEKLSGAKIRLDLKSIPQLARIYGTSLQREKAKALINETVIRFTSRPAFGSFLLAIDDIEKFKDIKYRFVEFADNNKNIMTKYLSMQRYLIEKIRESDNGRDTDELEDVISDRNYETTDELKLYNTRSALESSSFGTLDRLDKCLERIFTYLNNPSTNPYNSGRQIKFRVFFGRQTFIKVNPQAIFNVDNLCRLKRHSEDIGTIFAHDIPQIYENIEMICEKFKLKSDASNKDNKSISIVYAENDQQKTKIKLCWSEDDGLWKIERVVKNMKRHAIISIISGTEVPDLRFIVKTKCDIFINPRLKQLIKDLQKKRPIPDENGMWFRLSDFEGKLDCISVRQKINKNCYSNDKFKIIKVIETQEIRGYDQVTTERNVSLKNLYWRQDNQKTTKVDLDDDVASINETIEFAREIAKSVVKI